MDIEFGDAKLAVLETERAHESRLPVAAIKSFRRKLVVLRAAPDERTLRNWQSLHYEKLEGNREGQRSVRLNDQWRLVFTIDTRCTPNKLCLMSIEDYH